MFTSFNEKQERYSTPRSSSPSPIHNSTSTFNEVNKPQLSSPSDVVEENIGHIMFTENGGSILPADATIPGPYPTPPPPPPPPPPTSYSFTLSFTDTLGENETQACLLGIAGSAQSTYYSSVAT
jgi:hypothetical protein